jgi:MerR family copper efflux transcriptional regulator
MHTALNIGGAAKRSGVSAKMIRYYESIGLVTPADRTASNYRTYDARAVTRLRFIQRARSLGFSIDDIQHLLALWADRDRSSAEVKALALDHIAELETRIAALRRMQGALTQLAERCHGDDHPDCPIIDDLAGEGDAA